jgi:hypothetical protein
MDYMLMHFRLSAMIYSDMTIQLRGVPEEKP